MSRTAILTTILLLLGCKDEADGRGSPEDGDIDPDPSGDDEFANERDACVERINGFRASVDLPPYDRWREAEACADAQAESDAKTGSAHGAFQECGEWAQNECPGYPSVENVIESCLQMMWDEGPGDFNRHGHYINMTSTQYTKVACGFHVKSDGQVWAVQDYQ